MRPDIDELVMSIEKRIDAVPDTPELIPIASSNMRIHLHPRGNVIEKEDSPDV